ncbi:MAG: transposase [bacterium]|nr:transposase [bacterium]
MKYSLAFKESLVKKVLPPSTGSIKEVSRESGIAEQTLRNWINKAKEGTLQKGNTVSGTGRSPREKLNLVIEFRTIPEENIGRWLREKGLHTEHITQYEQELRDMAENKNHTEKQKIKTLEKKNKELQKELRKKEKALAEMAALYTLKKKAETFWGEDEDD